MRVTVDDATIDVATHGKGDAVVLIHGFPFAREIWDPQVRALAETALIVAPDLRGAGRSSAPDGPYLMETLAGDLAAVLDALQIDRAAIVGHSMGGYVAMAFARMYTERVTQLALVCSRLHADSNDAAREREELASLAERENSVDPIVNAYISKLFSQAALEMDAPAITRAREIASRNSVTGLAAQLRGMAQRVDACDIAAELDFPVLVLAGGADRLVSLEQAEEVRAAFPAADLQVLGRSGHVPMLEESERLTEALLAFLV